MQYAESQLPQQGESIAVRMAVAFTARIMQTFAAEADAYLDEYGFDEEYLVKPVGTPGVRAAVRARAAESLLHEIGRVVLEMNGINTISLGDDMAEMARQSVRDFTC